MTTLAPVRPLTELEDFEVEVTTDDIENGVIENGGYCPIALAVRRWLRRSDYECEDIAVQVGDGEFAWINGETFRFDAAAFVYLFDNGRTVDPGTVHFERWHGTGPLPRNE